MNYLRFFILHFVTMYIYIYICNDFKIFIFYSDLLKYCKALSTEKYKRYISILLFIIIVYPCLPNSHIKYMQIRHKLSQNLHCGGFLLNPKFRPFRFGSTGIF